MWGKCMHYNELENTEVYPIIFYRNRALTVAAANEGMNMIVTVPTTFRIGFSVKQKEVIYLVSPLNGYSKTRI